MFTELIQAYPKPSIVVISMLATLFITIINYYVQDRDKMKELKEVQKACRIKLKDAKGNPKQIAQINKQMMECSMEMMKHSFKPMLITFIPLIVLIAFIRSSYEPILSGWLWWYIGASIVSSIIFRKLFKM
ncbi:MAG: DUF106 domain-containing protein [Nanoarchaeota archaeon]|nr:DUF106 domain-containing protein [Nanoarchaeota archaeon]